MPVTTIFLTTLAVFASLGDATTITIQTASTALDPNQHNSFGANVSVSDPYWAPGYSWISYDNSGQGGIVNPDIPTTPVTLSTPPSAIFFQYFMIPAGTITSAFLTVGADDTAAVFVNGHNLAVPNNTTLTHCMATIGCLTAELGNFVITPYLFSGGKNEIEIWMYQINGDASGVMDQGTINYIPASINVVTPEPSMVFPLTIGLMFCAGMSIFFRSKKRKS